MRTTPGRNITGNLSLVKAACRRGANPVPQERGRLMTAQSCTLIATSLVAIQGKKRRRTGERLGRKTPSTLAPWDLSDPIAWMARMAQMPLLCYAGKKKEVDARGMSHV
jgi:hypothetical protein